MNKFNGLLNKLKAKAPELLIAAGVIGVGTATVLACKATKKTDDIVAEHNAKVEEIHKNKELGATGLESGIPITYTEENAKKDLTKTYLTTTGKFIKLYLPSAIVMTASLGCILGSHRILNKRNAALAAAYTTLDTCYKDYRANVIEKYGEQVDYEMAYGIKANKEKEGEETSYKQTKTEVNLGYSRIFDEENGLWEENPDYNFQFLLNQQQWCNDRLKAKGVLFLNDVYETLGFEPTQAGQVIGWVYDPLVEAKIDFGLFNIKNKDMSKSILLTFNTDGNVLDLMDKKI